MKKMMGGLKNPRAIGIACALGATGLGLAYMAAAGAPTMYLAVNALALLMGLAIIGLMWSAKPALHLPDGFTLLLGGMLLATALLGISVEGATRWLRVGGLSVQMSLIVVPAMLVSFARHRNLLSTLAVVVAAVALAAQPDRAMAGVLASSLAVLAIYRPDRWALSALVFAGVGFSVAVLRPDMLPAVPYVDRILYTAFSVHWLAGLAVIGGALLLVVPAIAGQRFDPEHREVYLAFGFVWLGVVVASALGNYPTPLVGYGASSVIGYALSLSLLPGRGRSAVVAEAREERGARVKGETRADLRVGVAS